MHLNGNLQQPIWVDTNAMEWTSSPSGTVWRKRLHRVGPAESGQVTSVVRYEPGATFPPHDHPEGEEILVLDGVFSDEHGDWPVGTYLLNPEGFRHGPFSKEGCLLFVKLRQYPGLERQQQQLDTSALEWVATDVSGREAKILYQQAGFEDRMYLERWSAGTHAELRWDQGVEIFVMAGEWQDGETHHPTGSWLRLPPGSTQHARSLSSCELYIKEGGFAYLRES